MGAQQNLRIENIKLRQENAKLLELLEKAWKETYDAIYFMAQLGLDVGLIAANEALGVGENRAPSFAEYYNEVMGDLLQKIIMDDPDLWYVQDIVDRRLRPICGKNFQTWDERYN